MRALAFSAASALAATAAFGIYTWIKTWLAMRETANSWLG